MLLILPHGVFNRCGHGTVRGMRHLWTLIAAVVVAPVAWLLIAYGQPQSAAAFAKSTQSGIWHPTDFVWPLVFLAGAGLLLGLLATLRFSPLGAVLAGLFYVTSYVAVLFDGKDVYKLLSQRDVSLFNHRAHLYDPVINGTTLLLGALLLVAVASVSRWRRWPLTEAEPVPGEIAPEAEPGTEETKDFWTPTTPVTTPLGGSQFDDPNTERVVPGQFGSPWRTPPGENEREEQSR
jgi:hypothetical protein